MPDTLHRIDTASESNLPLKDGETPNGLSSTRETFLEKVGTAIEGASKVTITEKPTSGQGNGGDSKAGTKQYTQKKEVKHIPVDEEELKKELKMKIMEITKELDQSLAKMKKQTTFSAKEMHETIKRRRSFSTLLKELTNMALGKLKELYMQYFPNVPE